MAKSTSVRTPKYRRQKGEPHDRAFVQLGDRRVYLGRHGSPKSEREYHRVVSEWLAAGRQLSVAADQLTIVELVDRFMQHAETYYHKPSGEPTSTIWNYKLDAFVNTPRFLGLRDT